MQTVIALMWFLAWLYASRQLFRWAVRNEFPRFHDYRCCCCNHTTCGNYRILPKVAVAVLAMLAALAFPVTLIFVAVMYRAPLSRTELDRKIRQLENENSRLRGISNER